MIPKKPKSIAGIPLEGAMERLLKKLENQPQKLEPIVNQSNIKEDNYIFVPSMNIYIAKQRTHLGLNWYDTHKQLHSEGLVMPTINEFREFLKYLKENPHGVPGASPSEVGRILDDILAVKDPWRAEWLDADFKVDNNELYIHYNHRTVSGRLVPQNKELVTDYLTQDKTPGIDLDSWIQNANVHGLPKPKVKKGDLYYRSPLNDNNSVARFFAYSDRVGLDCYRYPIFSNSSLGVRSV